MNKKNLIIIGIVIVLVLAICLYLVISSGMGEFQGNYFTAKWSGNGGKTVTLKISGTVPEGYSWRESGSSQPFNVKYIKTNTDITKLKLSVSDGSMGSYDFVCSAEDGTEYSKLRLNFDAYDNKITIQSASFLNEAQFFKKLSNTLPFNSYLSENDYSMTFKIPDERKSWVLESCSEGLLVDQSFDLENSACLFEITPSTSGALTASFVSADLGSRTTLNFESEQLTTIGENGDELLLDVFKLNYIDCSSSDYEDPQVQSVIAGASSAVKAVKLPAAAKIAESYTADITKADGEFFVDDGDKMLCLEYNVDGNDFIHYMTDNYSVDEIKKLWSGLDKLTKEVSDSAEIYSSADMPVSVACWSYAGTSNALISKNSKEALLSVLPELLK